jgi:asparagine synthase (glutamine-hydrolysing)
MCGINGIVSVGGKETRQNCLEKMNVKLKHRGPDDDGTFSDDYISLGQTRLSIIDLSSAGHQPMHSEDGKYSIVFNGEIYNYLEVKKYLITQNFPINFKTKTDTEVLLYAYIYLKEKCLELLNGMFAFCIYNQVTKDIFIARDRLGIKPFYYAFDSTKFVFSSETRPILESKLFNFNLDTDSLVDYIRYQTVHAPNTIIEQIKMLPTGHFVTFNANAINPIFTEYWSITKNRKINNAINYNEAKEITKEKLSQSVKRRLVADVPFGAFLSGGIDSSAIVALMSKENNSQVSTFSVTFEEEEYSEAPYARRIAEKYNTKHNEIKLNANDFLNEVPNALNAMDHPSGDGPNTYVVSKATKNAGITMALSGLGGDEVFAGYDCFKRAFSFEKNNWIKNIPTPIRKTLAKFYLMQKQGVQSEKIAEILGSKEFSLATFYASTRKMFVEENVKKIISFPIHQDNFVEKLFNSNLKNFDSKNELISQISFAEISTYMQNVLLRDTDQMSMAVALEVRVPFLDYELVEFVTGLNDTIKFPHSPKKLLVDSLGDLLPPEIVNRPKMGFTFPWKNWLKKEMKEFAEHHIEQLSKRTQFNEKEIKNLWNRFLNNDTTVTWSRIWYLLVLNNWLEQNNLN